MRPQPSPPLPYNMMLRPRRLHTTDGKMRFDLRDNLITRNYTVRLFLTSILLTLSSANYAFDNQGFGQVGPVLPLQRSG